jgi:hypothetical protein
MFRGAENMEPRRPLGIFMTCLIFSALKHLETYGPRFRLGPFLFGEQVLGFRVIWPVSLPLPRDTPSDGPSLAPRLGPFLFVDDIKEAAN